jgi:hypothetical protein
VLFVLTLLVNGAARALVVRAARASGRELQGAGAPQLLADRAAGA